MLPMLLLLSGCLINAPLYSQRVDELACQALFDAWTEDGDEQARLEALDSGCSNGLQLGYADCDGDGLGDSATGAWVTGFDVPAGCPGASWASMPGDCNDADGIAASWADGACAAEVVFLPQDRVLVVTDGIAQGARASCERLGLVLHPLSTLPDGALEGAALAGALAAGDRIWLEAAIEDVDGEEWCEPPDVGALLAPLSGDPDARAEALQGLTPAWDVGDGCLTLPTDFRAQAHLCTEGL